MIQYDCCMGNYDYWLCFMTELWYSRGSSFCKTFMQLPDGARYITVHCVYTDKNSSVVAVPDLGISLYNKGLDQEDCILNILERDVDRHAAVSIAKTIEVMEHILARECGSYDGKSNLAAGCEPLTFEQYQSRSCLYDDDDDEDEDLPF